MLAQYSVYGRCPDRQVHTGAAQRDMSDELVAPLNTGIASAVRARDVELAVVNAELSQSDTSRIRIISEPCKERFLVFFLAISLLVPSIVIVFVVANEWMSSPSQRGWLILGFGFYIMTAMRYYAGLFAPLFSTQLPMALLKKRKSKDKPAAGLRRRSRRMTHSRAIFEYNSGSGAHGPERCTCSSLLIEAESGRTKSASSGKTRP